MLSLLGVPLNKNNVSVVKKWHAFLQGDFAACGSLPSAEPGEHSTD